MMESARTIATARTASHSPKARRHHSIRSGYTLVELLISMGASTILMAGMASAVLISNQAMSGVGVVEERRDAAEVQADMLADFTQAKLFTTRTSTEATFTVPDRDGDTVGETISYSWTDTPNFELQYAYNGGAPVPVLSNVQNFNLAYSSRFMIGGAAAPLAMDPNSWGYRWQTGGSFGFEDVFATSEADRRNQIATRVTLETDQTIVSISAYFSGGSEVGMAIYSSEFKNDKWRVKDLITHTPQFDLTGSGWVTLSVAPTLLTAGEYYLALTHQNDGDFFRSEATGGDTYVENNNPLHNNGEWSSSFTSQSNDTRKISIYGTYQ